MPQLAYSVNPAIIHIVDIVILLAQVLLLLLMIQLIPVVNVIVHALLVRILLKIVHLVSVGHIYTKDHASLNAH